jgi:hypothetical protein
LRVVVGSSNWRQRRLGFVEGLEQSSKFFFDGRQFGHLGQVTALGADSVDPAIGLHQGAKGCRSRSPRQSRTSKLSKARLNFASGARKSGAQRDCASAKLNQ